MDVRGTDIEMCLRKLHMVNSLLASGNFCYLLITFANSLNPDQDRHNVGPDLDPNCLSLMVFLKEFFEKLFFVKSQQTTTTAQKNYPACKELTSIKELQRQKMEYENKKKVAEQLRRQQEEEDEREQRRRAAMRLQEEQKAMLERQREETRVQEEQARAWEEARKREVHIAGFLSQDKAKPKYEQ